MKFRDAIFVEERKHSQPSESTGVTAFVIQNYDLEPGSVEE